MKYTYEQTLNRIKKLGFAGRVSSNVVLVQEALNRGINVSKTPSGKSFQLSHCGRDYWWRGGNNSLNTPLSKRVTQYKTATNALLNAQGVRTANSFLFDENDLEIAWGWARKFPSVVVKPDDSQGGSDVFLDINDFDEFQKHFAYVADRYDGKVLVEPFFSGEQLRFLMIKNEVAAVALMRPASVVGDGKSNINKLVKLKNKRRESHESHEIIKIDDGVQAHLKAHGFSLESIPEKGARVYLSQISNLQRGGDSVDFTDKVTSEQKIFVENVMKAIPGLRIAGVDIVANINGDFDNAVVLEVNCSPQLSIHHFPWEGEPRNVASHVLEAFFPELKQDSTSSQ